MINEKREKHFRDLLKGKETTILEVENGRKLIMVNETKMIYSIADENSGYESCAYGHLAYYERLKREEKAREKEIR
jgi:hypothetical protein